MERQQAVLLAKIESLDRSRRGYVGAITRTCNEIDKCIQDINHVIKVKSLQGQLVHAWQQYQTCCQQYFALLDTECGKCHEVRNQFYEQKARVKLYEERIALFIENTTTMIETELTQLEAELAQLRSSMKETSEQYSVNVSSMCQVTSGQVPQTSPGLISSTEAPVFSLSSASGPSTTNQSHVFTSLSSLTPKTAVLTSSPSTATQPFLSTPLSSLTPKTTVLPSSPRITAQPYESTPSLSSLIPKDAILPCIQDVSTVMGHAVVPEPCVSENERLCAQVKSSSDNFHIASATSTTPIMSVSAEHVFPRVSTQANMPAVSKENQQKEHNYPASPQTRLLPPNVYAGVTTSTLSTPAKMSTTTHFTDANSACVHNEGMLDLTSIASAIANISMTQDLPKVQVQKFDGSPDKYPTFRHRFRQMVEQRSLDDSVKMTLLLQFLEGPALKAVQRYEALPGGVSSALKTLEDRFGRPSQVVRACVDALTRGPVIQNSDKQALQQLADDAQVTYDTLEAMGCLSEMNTDNLERIISRLPKWAQTKFVENVNRKRKGREMPTFKDVVDFLKDRADVMNHPFFSKSSSDSGTKPVRVDAPRYRPASHRATTLATTIKREELCYMCGKPHRLYRCELFKSKTPRERSEFVKTKRLCFNCLSSTEHTSKTCKCLTRCQVSGCGKPHHSLLHYNDFKPTANTQRDNKREANDNNLVNNAQTSCCASGSCSTTTTVESSRDIMLQVLPVKIINDKSDVITTYCLIDSGSDVTLIDPSLTKELNIKGTPGRLCLNTVSDNDMHNQAMKVSFKLASVNDQDSASRVVTVQTAWAVKELNIPLKHAKIVNRTAQWPHLQQVSFPDVQRKKVSILLGTNVSEAFIPVEVKRGKPREPVAIRSCLGWSILGGAAKDDAINQHFSANCTVGEDVLLSRQLQEFWKIESHGTINPKSKSMSVEDRQALRNIDNTITKNGDHYQMGLLWKDENHFLPNNRALAEARLQHLKKRFRRDPELEAKYRAVMNEYMAKGYARKLTDEETSTNSNVTWYLPHHPVQNPNKPGKVRVVFDAAAKFSGTALNDCLLQGPSLTNDIPGVLIRFRQHEVAFTADIQAMFNQVKVLPEDTDALRFLWWPGSTEDPPEEYKMLVHVFGAKSSPCCANKALRTTADDGKERYNPEVIETVHQNFYVDDVLKSTITTEEVTRIATDLVKLLKEGGFRLTKFTSNRREVLAALPSEDRANPQLDLDLEQLPIQRALGICWDPESDNFQFKVIPTEKPPTKRGILSVISSLFDPLGFLGPFVLPVKILLQDLWRKAFPWDQEIPEPYLSIWRKWVQSLPLIVTIQVPRCYKSAKLGIVTTRQLHHFSDASRQGYAAVSYLRMVDDCGNIHCAFVMGKSRNAPLKEWSIPRLELQAAVLATRLNTTVSGELEEPVDGIYFWSDSMTTLQYVRNKTRRFHTLVANRLTEIHETTSPEQWHFVPGALNGMDVQSFKPGCRWWSGADFLWKSEDHWPNEHIGEVPENDQEVRKECHVTSTYESRIEYLIQRQSSWPRLLRVTSYVLRFIKRVRKQKVPGKSTIITLTEIQAATEVIVKATQQQHFQEELLALQRGEPVKASSKLATLNPKLVDGILRVGGRIHSAPVSFEVRHPIILPKDNPVSNLLVTHYHRILGHAGREHVLSTLRQRYWIPRGRSLVRHLQRQCVPCRKRNSPIIQQKMADLPKERLVPYQPPFTYTGIDFFGPFHVKRGRTTVKVYGCIFVCFNSRAVHIEDVSSLETDTFIQALHRFIAVRGQPKEIWSDNGTNFCGAEKELRRSVKELDEETIKRDLHSREVEWHSCPIPQWRFQPPTASHMSGVWERIIRSIRKSMKGVIGDQNALVSHETLRTVFAEVTSILNSRPICPNSDDPDDLEALTPNHFLLQRQNLVIPPGIFNKNDVYSRKQWRHSQFLAKCFWQRWLREYIPTLQLRRKWTTPKTNLKENDLVLVVDNTLPRSKWLLGRVTKVFPGNDGHVRVVEVKTKNSVLVRPVSKLCLLEESN